MEFVQLVQHLPLSLAEITTWSDISQVWLGHLNFDWTEISQGIDLHWAVLAQQFETDVFAGTRKVVGEFVASGKLWTLLIGIAIGYILKSVTSYG